MSITANHIAPQGGGFEPQRANNFYVELYGVPGADKIKLAVATAFVPEWNNDVILVHYQGEERKVAGKAKFGAGNVTVVDMIDENIYKSVADWKKLVHDPETGKIGRATLYKKQAALILNGPDDTAYRTWKIDGIWPSQVTGSQLNYANSAYFTVNMTLQFDRAISQL